MSIYASSTGDFKDTIKKLEKYNNLFDNDLYFEKYAQIGLESLKKNTPTDSGETKESWSYNIVRENGKVKIVYNNNSVIDGKHKTPIVILLQYGHALKNGVWIDGIDFINPSLKPVFEQMLIDINRELKNA